jgi:putative transposase
MPRQARLDAPGTLHHVMARGSEGKPIFADEEDREQFLHHVGELAQATQTRIAAWTLMDNHFHLLLYSGPQGLPKFMRRLLTGHAIRFNRKYRRHGHLFQDRYKSIVCEEDRYFLELVRYIHLNPLRAGRVKDMKELDRYPWSGHSVLVGRSMRGWQSKEEVLGWFGSQGSKAIRSYREFMEEGKGQGKREDLVGGGLIRSVGGWSRVLGLRDRREDMAHDPRVLGGGDFVANVQKEAEARVKRQLMGGERREVVRQVIKDFCDKAGIGEGELRGGGQRRQVSDLRKEIAYYLGREVGVSMAEIGRQVGVSASAVAKEIQKIESEKK